MPNKPLTAYAVRNLKPKPEGRYEVHDGVGLRLSVHPTGKKVWLLRYRRPGTSKNAKLTLGHWHEGEMEGEPVIGGPLTISAARELAARLLRDKAQGKDPASERKAAKLAHRMATAASGNTFGAVALDFVREHCLVRLRRWQETASPLGVIEEKPRGRVLRPNSGLGEKAAKLALRPGSLAAAWAHRPLSEITPMEISAVVAEAGKRPLAGRRIRVKGESPSRGLGLYMALSGLMRWCVETHRLERSPVTGRAPWTPASRDRVLSDEEVRALWACLEDWESTGMSVWHASALKLLLITGQRRQEITELRWDEIEGGELVLGPGRTKNKRMHTLPLPKMALAVLGAMPRIAGSPWVFSEDGVRPIAGWGGVKKVLDLEMARRLRLGRGAPEIGLAAEIVKPWRLHDLRRTMATGMARLGTPIHITEKVLNHVSGSFGGLVGVYQRWSYREEVLAALELWAKALTRINVSGSAVR
jgi:integrase